MDKAKEQLKPLIDPLMAICKLLDKGEWSGMIIGGVAASILGIPRFTRDIDVVVWLEEKDVDLFLKEARKLNIEPRIHNLKEFAKKNRVLLMHHKKSNIPLDISLGMLPFEKKAIDKSKQVKIGDFTLPLPAPEDLIILKAIAHRLQDILDIEGIIKSQSNLRKRYILQSLKEFASLLEMPEIYEDVKRILAK
ncbi:MAG: nucleotidyltransferase [bacterium]|nr:nucleotidyltransferase [bacterium]